MKWYKIVLLSFFLTFLVLFTDARAGCHYRCAGDRIGELGCGYCFEAVIDLSGTSRCLINKNNECRDFGGGCGDYIYYG
ncbi:MAG: hypothetical protein QW602_00255, partial [Candidatus Aenigmatarchaeota archaeon]